MTFTDRLEFPDAPLPMRFYVHENAPTVYIGGLVEVIEHVLWFANICDDLSAFDYGIGTASAYKGAQLINFQAHRLGAWPQSIGEEYRTLESDTLKKDGIVDEEQAEIFYREEKHRKECLDLMEYLWSAPPYEGIRPHGFVGVLGTQILDEKTPLGKLRVLSNSDVEQPYQI
jgi:hypothetical protein